MSQINETAIKTPGVYTTEIPLFPPSVAQVATAIPAFIGYTKKAIKNGKSVINQAVRISSLVQYVQYFGDGFDNLSASVILNGDNSVSSVSISPKYQLFNAIQMFFNHGGLNCYIISVGLYKSNGSADIQAFIKAGAIQCFEVLQKEDEPTLIVIPDAVLLPESDFNSVMVASLKQCSDLQDRFAILDILNGDQDRSFDSNDVILKFRNGVGGSNLNYGAAYYPWLRTNLQYSINYKNTQFQKPAGTNITLSSVVSGNPFLSQLDKVIADQNTIVTPFISALVIEMLNTVTQADLTTRVSEIAAMISGLIGLAGFTDITPATTNGLTVTSIHANLIKPGVSPALSSIEKLMQELIQINGSYPLPGSVPNDLGGIAAGTFNDPPYNLTIANNVAIYGTVPPTVEADAVKNINGKLKALYDSVIFTIKGFNDEIQNLMNTLEQQLVSSNYLYANTKNAIKSEGIIVPPSGAIAGVYAAIDGTRGVWKAPANVSLNTVIEPMVNIDNNMQDDLNVDTNSGKSVNAIRAFAGKGNLVWGARTLAGNDAEWRYISVRRLFIMIEESAKKSTFQFVFEPNDANTWVKVRAMLENYLTLLWRQGALAGAKPEQAFFVKCGLGQTMTAQDILDGRLIIEIGLAAVRPAEFIILRFMHKLQES